ncbi:MAG TPA: Crp/Fnr family transcriptional regulator [Chloroflexota bacterium]|nr:Crp/Fnr family transcriptional regulator [Chloroflexota bacterium]
MNSTLSLAHAPLVSAKMDGRMDTLDFLQHTDLFGGVPVTVLKRIMGDVVERPFAQGDIIFRQGDPGRVLYLVKSGQVRIFINGLDGTETSVILLGRPGNIFGELAIIDGLPRSATAVAMEATILLTISREAFRDHMRQNPQLALNFMQELSSKVRHNTRNIDTLTTMPVPQRLARQLMEMAQNYGQAGADGVFINSTLTQGQLATLIGATRESTNKALRDFRERQWILMANGRITILDPDALRAEIAA